MYNLEQLDTILKRFSAFWEGELYDRGMLAVTCPAQNAPAPPEPASLEQKWLDSSYRFRRFQAECSGAVFLGDALPVFFPNLGPGVVANFMGGEYSLAENTVWFDRNPLVQDVTALPDLSFDAQSPMWRVLENDYAQARQEGKDACFTAFSDLGGSIDIAAALVGAENLMMEFYDHPEEVHALIERVDEAWLESFRLSCGLLEKHQKYYSSWLPLLREIPWYPLQADLCVMLSPDIFEEFVAPSLQKFARAIGGHATYHLDGRGELRHLETILSIPEIDTVEWVPDRYDGPYLDSIHPEFFPYLKRIQQSGRNLILRSVNPKLIDMLFEEISPKGVYLTTYVPDEESANVLLRRMERCSLGR